RRRPETVVTVSGMLVSGPMQNGVPPERSFCEMSKKEPDCKTGWHTTGTLKVLPGIDQIARRMEGDSAVEMHGMAPTGRDDWWSYDAVWMTKDGARVRSRLKVYNRIPGGEPDPALDDLDPRTYDPAVNPLEGYFHIFAKADRPCDPSCPSPPNV